MPRRNSTPAAPRALAPNIVRAQLDDVDRRLVRELVADARIPNNALA
jgi:hypothetical protein